ncbi:MAG: hypothetical protein JNJ64_07130 [Flavobacteriales bacterium]|nr:hypothetical protein [Flavobacteriales bacterium]
MTRSCALLALGGVPGLLVAQCQIQSYTLSANCAQHAPLASVVLSGGTPPYQLVFTASNGPVWSAQSVQNGLFTTSLPTWPSVFEPPVALQVTDAQGCMANSSAFYIIHVAMWPEVWFEFACGGSAVDLYWNGLFSVAGSPGQQSPCGFGEYQVTGLQGFDQSGTVATGWTQVTPGIWRFNTSLPLGSNYSVRIWPSGSPTGCSAGPLFHCNDAGSVFVPAAPMDCGVRLQMRAALAGALPSGTLMTDALRTANLIPLTEPYGALGYQYTGMPTNPAIQPSTLSITGNNAVVDWVVVELRADASPGTVVYSAPALLERDGDVVEVNGTSNWLYAPVPAGKYYVAVRHRNHLGVMTAGPIWLSGSSFVSTVLVNFRSALLSVHGVEPRKTVGTVQCLWPAEATGDGVVKYTGAGNDRDVVLNAIGGTTPTNTANNVYDRRDVNLDGSIKYTGSANDRDVILQTIGGTVPTATRTQQLP